MWSILNFGKHAGKTLPMIVLSDPDWFFWAYSQKTFFLNHGLQAEADDIYRKAINIKIPDTPQQNLRVEYYIHSGVGKFSHFEIISANQPQHIGSSGTIIRDRIDLSFPRQLSSYDKMGCKLMLSCIKTHVFLNNKIVFKKKVCEDFFNNPDNFL